MEFTDLDYEFEIPENFFLTRSKKTIHIHILSLEKIEIAYYGDDLQFKSSNIINLNNEIKSLLENQKGLSNIFFSFNNSISFQDYISVKSILSKLDLSNVSISNKEFICN